MAVDQAVPKHGPFLTGAFFLGIILVFIGERIIGESGLTRTLIDGIGAAICGGTLVVRLIGRSRLNTAAAQVETLASILYGIGLLGLLVYWITSPSGLELLGLDEGPVGEHVSAILGGFWVVLIACCLLPLLFVELSCIGMPAAGAVEIRRVYISGASGLTLALALTYLVAFNYASTELEVRRDLSYFKLSLPSEASIKMVERLDESLDVTLFYPDSNEVLERVRPYFDELASKSGKVRVEVKDLLLAPRLAEEHKIKRNGHILLTRGKQGESFEVGLKLESARRRLKKLDSRFQEHFSAVTRPEQVFYSTVGHGERTTRRNDQGEGEGISDLSEFVRRFGLRQRNLGLAEGLATEVPDDAAVVAIIGPRRAFLAEEVAALTRYAKRGGRLLIMVEPDTSTGLDPLLEALGLELQPGQLAHEQHHRPLTRTKADRGIIFTNGYSAHAAVTTVRRLAKGGATAFNYAGSMKQGNKGDSKVRIILRAMPGTWSDLNGDFEFDQNSESRGAHSIGAAVTLPNERAGETLEVEGDGEEAELERQRRRQEGRAVVIADSDVFTDGLLAVLANFVLAGDVMVWLSGFEGGVGEMESEEDQPIEHTRTEDTLWFWSTVVFIPALVLGLGLVYVTRRRRRLDGRSS